MLDQQEYDDVFPKTLDLFSDDSDLREACKDKRLGGKNHSVRYSDAEIRVLLSAFTKQKYLSRDELAYIAAEMREGNTPSSVLKWFKLCRANQRKVGKQERAKRRDARYTKAK